MTESSEAQIARIRERFASSRSVPVSAVRVVVSPYRVCPIGAHIDHQGGPVLAMAVGAYTLLPFHVLDSPEVRLTSENYPGVVRFDLSRAGEAGEDDWGRYARGAAFALSDLLAAEPPRGIDGHVVGSLPGVGLSSSASVILAYLRALSAANGLALDSRDLALRALRAERDFVGVRVGVLDPAAIVAARKRHLAAIDSRECRWELVPFGEGAPEYRILIAYSGVTRNLSSTDFNRRVEECFSAARKLGEAAGREGTRALDDLPDAVLDEHGGRLSPTEALRARHFFGERARVRRALRHWRAGELEEFGAIMNESCRSSIENWECGSKELIEIQDILVRTGHVFGSRFSGGGWGGCCVALVAANEAEDVRSRVERAMREKVPGLRDRAGVFLLEEEDGIRIS